jgi:hypothetical protein
VTELDAVGVTDSDPALSGDRKYIVFARGSSSRQIWEAWR